MMIKSKFRTALTALAVGTALTVAPSASASVSASATAGSAVAVTTGAIFNDPTSTDAAAEQRIRLHLIDLVKGAEAGSSIRISLYLLQDQGVTDQLVAAHKRNVTVQVILDGDSTSGAATSLKAGLAEPGSPDSWLRMCKTSEACLALDPGTSATDPDGWYTNVNHNKFFLFSRTKGAGDTMVDNVVVQSSGNLTAADYKLWWNDALTVAGNAELFTAYRTYFEDQAAAAVGERAQVADYAHDTQAGKAKVYFFPRSGTDVVVNILKTVAPAGTANPCGGNTAGVVGTADGRTKIRIAQGHITRTEVARQLWLLAEAGCHVEVVYRSLDNWDAATDKPQSEVADWLTRPTTGKGRVILHDLANDERGGTDTHTKYLLIEGTYLGGVDKRIVFTGSHTYTGMALKVNDETLLKYEDPAVFAQYATNFEAQRAASLAERDL